MLAYMFISMLMYNNWGVRGKENSEQVMWTVEKCFYEPNCGITVQTPPYEIEIPHSHSVLLLSCTISPSWNQ